MSSSDETPNGRPEEDQAMSTDGMQGAWNPAYRESRSYSMSDLPDAGLHGSYIHNDRAAEQADTTAPEDITVQIAGGMTDGGKQNGAVSINIDDNKNKMPDDGRNSRAGTSNGKTDTSPKNDAEWLEWVEQKFKEIADTGGQIDKDKFKKAIGVRKSFFADRLFELFDEDKSGTIELGEMMNGLKIATKGSPMEKLRLLFNVYDKDGNGTIEHDELKAALKACMDESAMALSEDTLEELTDVLFTAADVDASGEITFDELHDELRKHQGVIDNLTISAAQWLKPPPKKAQKNVCGRYCNATYIRNNIRKVLYLIFYFLINAALFGVAVWQYRESNHWIWVARGCGLCLNFNCMWILVLMLRNSLTLLRMTWFGWLFPIDQHVMFHKLAGLFIAFFSLIHTVAHCGNAVTISGAQTGLEAWEILFTDRAGIGWVDHSAFITGWIMDVILIIIVICSMPFVRANGYFQVFYWTHMLYLPFWFLVIIHGPHFWKWFVGPGTIFVLEKIVRSKLIKLAHYGDTCIEEVNLLSSGVTHLVISRPSNFRYHPGDYLFIQIPAIARHEWHPFTISSAPEMDGHLWLHVRSAGHWTNKLYKYFDELDPKLEVKRPSRRPSSRLESIEQLYTRRSVISGNYTHEKRNKCVNVKCYIDGPYGTGTREVFETEHSVLVGAGIGVTPMASILQSVWYRLNAMKELCPRCGHVYLNDETAKERQMRLRKVDFIWVCRDLKSLEWFMTLLNQIEIDQRMHPGFLDDCINTHLYITGAQKKTDMKGVGLQIALDLIYEKNQKDALTGLKTRTQAGRPDWNQLLKGIKYGAHGTFKVFICGPAVFAAQVKEAAVRNGYAVSKENF